MTVLFGVDVCRTGWVVASRNLLSGAFNVEVVASFAEILLRRPSLVCIDIPIGILDVAGPGGRDCDREARAFLGPGRGSSVFSAPTRPVLTAPNYAAACAMNRATSSHRIGISKQSWAIVPRIAEVDAHMTTALQDTVFEVHPEVCFAELAGNPLRPPKRSASGRALRASLLAHAGYSVGPFIAALGRPTGAAQDDVLDASVALWTANRILLGSGVRMPAAPPLDARGLRMEIWR